nr:immunoglobulin heavy chain junction region [Mus musculus]
CTRGVITRYYFDYW